MFSGTYINIYLIGLLSIWHIQSALLEAMQRCIFLQGAETYIQNCNKVRNESVLQSKYKLMRIQGRKSSSHPRLGDHLEVMDLERKDLGNN